MVLNVSTDGWLAHRVKGLLERRSVPLDVEAMRGTLPRGTVIGTSRANPYKLDGGVDRVSCRSTL